MLTQIQIDEYGEKGFTVFPNLLDATEVAGYLAEIDEISSEIESPIDYNKSQIKKLPLAADSLTMDCQYFSFDESTERSKTTSLSNPLFPELKDKNGPQRLAVIRPAGQMFVQ